MQNKKNLLIVGGIAAIVSAISAVYVKKNAKSNSPKSLTGRK